MSASTLHASNFVSLMVVNLGRRVTLSGEEIDYDIGQIDFGEPGTNGQHSFFQLLHMGQVLLCFAFVANDPTHACLLASAKPPTHMVSCSAHHFGFYLPQVCPAEFIGFTESQHHLHVEGEKIASHDELMANFFAQPDALAFGKVRMSGVLYGSILAAFVSCLITVSSPCSLTTITARLSSYRALRLWQQKGAHQS